MKKCLLTLAAGILFLNLLSAHSGDPETPKNNSSETTAISLKDIFLSDYDNVTLFIDFQAVAGEITELNVLKNGQALLEDDVRDLPGNTIYELNLEVMNPGTYDVELKTAQGITIQKELIVE